MNLFEMIGMEIPNDFNEVGKKDTKKKSSKPEKKENKKASKKGTGKTIDVKSGLTIKSAFYPDILLERNSFEKDTATTTDIFSMLKAIHMDLVQPLWDLSKSSEEGVYNLYLKYHATMLRETSQLKAYDKKYTIRLADFEIPVEENIVTLSIVKELWESAYPEFNNPQTQYIYDEESGIIIPIINPKMGEKFKLPIEARIFGQAPITIEHSLSENNVNVEHEDNISKEEESVEENSKNSIAETKNDSEEVTYQQLCNLVAKAFNLENCKLANTSAGILVFPCEKNSSGTSKRPEEKYPADTTISLAFKRFKVSPEDFGGKEEITADDIFKFLSEDYPEYSKDRSTIQYDKKLNWILVSYLSSKKGAPTFDTEEQAINYFVQEENSGETYSLCYISAEPKKIRLERTPVGFFRGGNEEERQFVYALPKIPANLFKYIQSVFKRVANEPGGPYECAAQIFYDKHNDTFFSYFPKQKVNQLSVEYERNMILEQSENYVLVMDVHSHHVMPACFSSQDDYDEKGTRLFLVIGNFSEKNPERCSCCIRAGVGGEFIPVNLFDIFTDSIYTEELYPCYVSEEGMSTIKSSITFK